MLFQCPKCKCTIDAGTNVFGAQVGCGSCGEIVNVPESRLAPGMILGDFLILQPISKGASASVFLASQVSLQREVALKVLHPEQAGEEDQVQGFVREARSVARLNHPGIVQIYAVSDEDGYYYFAMELVRGRSIKEILQEDAPPSLEWCLDVCRKVALSLNHAGREGNLIHRDIKPSNIIIRNDGAVKLSNLGMAKSVDALRADEGHIEGTPQYISPEAVQGKKMDLRSDIYSLGATLYHMVTGRPPFRGKTASATAQMHVDKPLVPPHERRPDLPGHVSRVIMTMMEKNPDDRFSSLKSLAGALRSTTTRNTRFGTDTNRALRDRRGIMETQVMPTTDTDPTVIVQTRRLAAEKKSASLDRMMVYVLIGAIVVVVLLVGTLAGIVYVKKKQSPPTTPNPVPAALAPTVNAGADQTIRLPAKADLRGSAKDDGLPNGVLQLQWSSVNGPGRVVFGDSARGWTTAEFSMPGVYTLQLSADDTETMSTDTMTVTVEEEELKSPRPRVMAGHDRWISIASGKLDIDAKVTIDRRVQGAEITINWSKVSGPGEVAFSSGNRVDTGVTFSAPGKYVLRLTVDAAEHDASDDVTVFVQEKELEGPAVAAINCGGPEYIAKDGLTYAADSHFRNGQQSSNGRDAPVGETEDDALYSTKRWNKGRLHYQIPVENGKYQVVLRFVETVYKKPVQRVFDIQIERPRVAVGYDIVVQAGVNKAHDLVFPVTVNDRKLDIHFHTRIQNPCVSAIVVRAIP